MKYIAKADNAESYTFDLGNLLHVNLILSGLHLIDFLSEPFRNTSPPGAILLAFRRDSKGANLAILAQTKWNAPITVS